MPREYSNNRTHELELRLGPPVKPNNYNFAHLLNRTGITTSNAESIRSRAQEYCDRICTGPHYLSPMTCIESGCEVRKVKKRVIELLNSIKTV